MSNSVNGNGDGTPRSSSHLSPISAAISPTWRPPKTPLSPHRLAKLANALGVATPVPASHSPSSFLSRSFSETANTADHFRRSPTPSASASSMGFSSYVPTTSKFLLHVIPPVHLPHDSDNAEDLKLVTPPNAPGYHTQFRRGTLVPVHSTLQAQLGAIAKEYALPSTVGLILYLVTATPQSPAVEPNGFEEPGPRLSEDIWRHLWTRVLRTEREDMLMPSRSPTPLTPQAPHLLGYGPAGRSTPLLPTESANSPLRPFIASPSGTEPFAMPHSPQPTYPATTAPSTPSSISDIRSNNKSAPPSSVSQSDIGTPDTSVEDSGLRANSFDLPGLSSPSLIPILAKVEFDIDRRKAGWYEPWVRSRKANHAKRAESRKGSHQNGDGGDEATRGRVAPIELLMGKQKKKHDPFGLAADNDEEDTKVVSEEGYARLSESPHELEDSDGSDYDEDELLEDATARVFTLTGGKDPLDDVFGTDADTWADIHAERGGKPIHSNPNIVDLALTGAELSADMDRDSDDGTRSTKEEDDVREMLDIMGRPELAIAIPSPEKNNALSVSESMTSGRKIPPPLVLKKPKSGASVVPVPTMPTPRQTTGDSTDLAYLDSSPSPEEYEQLEVDDFDDYTRIRTPIETDKRGGAVFDDLDLGLDPSEDFDDPNDRRRSQIIMRAQLDEIERTMAQLSPRMLKTDLEEEQSMSFHSATLSPSSPGHRALSPRSLSSDFLPPPSPRLPQHPSPPESPTVLTGQSWPAVPFSAIKDKSALGSDNPNAPPSPPRLAVNGITTSAPKSYSPSRLPSTGPSESEKRKKELEDEGLYPPLAPGTREDSPSQSPVIPLSPDPFGRYPSSPEPPTKTIRTSGAQWDTMTLGRGIPEPEPTVKGRARSGTTTSRFSSDSLKGDEPSKSSNRTTLMSVKSIKKLWRTSKPKSTSSSNNNTRPPTPTAPVSGRTSPMRAPAVPPTPTTMSSGRSSPMVPPQRPERPSEEQLDLPDMPDIPPATFGRLSPQPPQQQQQSRASLDQMNQYAGRRPSQDQQLMPPPPSQRPSLDQANPPGPSTQLQQLSVPSYPGRNPNAGPIMTPHMQASRSGTSLDRLHFDQESPYPIRRSPPVRQSPRPPSPPPLPAIPEQEKNVPIPIAEPERNVTMKSILKWKSTASTNSSSNGNGTTKGHNSTPSTSSDVQPRSSFERPGAGNNHGRSRRPSVINFGSTRASVTSPDLPPSPPIPSQYTKHTSGYGGPLDHRSASQRSKLTNSSSADSSSHSSQPERQSSISTGGRSSSPPRSMHSSRDSQGSRPSFDASQFEFVSPKTGTLTYPYNSVDH